MFCSKCRSKNTGDKPATPNPIEVANPQVKAKPSVAEKPGRPNTVRPAPSQVRPRKSNKRRIWTIGLLVVGIPILAFVALALIGAFSYLASPQEARLAAIKAKILSCGELLSKEHGKKPSRALSKTVLKDCSSLVPQIQEAMRNNEPTSNRVPGERVQLVVAHSALMLAHYGLDETKAARKEAQAVVQIAQMIHFSDFPEDMPPDVRRNAIASTDLAKKYAERLLSETTSETTSEATLSSITPTNSKNPFIGEN